MSARSMEASDDESVRTGRRRWFTITLASIAVLAACVAGLWWAITAASSAGDVAVDKRETLALKTRWQASYDAILPIAKDFASTTGPTLDSVAYRSRVAAARRVVDAISDVPLTLPGNRDLRDSTLSGASEVLDGMEALLQAASKNDTPAVDAAAGAIDQGTTTLKDAGAALDAKIAARGWR